MKCPVWFLPFCVLTLAAGSAKYAKEGDTLRDRICACLKACGVTESDIEQVRAIMLENPADVK